MSKMPLSVTRDVQMIMSLLVVLLMLLSATTTATRVASTRTNRSSNNITKPGCRDRCGDIIVPYPFGMDSSNCFFDKQFEVTCNMSYNPPIPFLSFYEDVDYGYYGLEVLEFTLDYVRVNAPAPADLCFNNTTGERDRLLEGEFYGIQTLPISFGFSYTRNKLIIVGCEIFAYTTHKKDEHDENTLISGCASLCMNESVIGDLSSCLGSNGCCQSSIPEGKGRLDTFKLQMQITGPSDNTSTLISYPCGHGFLVDKEFSGFNKIITSRHDVYVPVILDWAIGNTTCEEVRRSNSTSYACGKNTYCESSKTGPGYGCNCSKGYSGNPYLGCEDVDECKVSNSCLKETVCENTEGSYLCHCPPGHYGDGRKSGTGCRRDKRRVFVVVVIPSGIGTSIFLIILPTIIFFLYRRLKERKQIITRQKYFKRNGGLLLKQSISSHDGKVEHVKIFVTEELERATDNFNQSRIIGKGGFGTVYKGMLSDGKIVAIKKSNIVDESQVDPFINEVIILSQINHRYIVKLLGCCLETEVPFLVYEFVSNGTLSYHLHGENHEISISWKDRLRIAGEVAGALAYLHSDASVPIFHRDIKSSNILLDDNYRAKLSDFGTSRLITSENTHLTTKVQGTFGYLDPEYFRSSQFTEKSDVYSFGVILVELLTGERAVSLVRSEEQMSLVWHFTSSMRDNRLFEILETRVVDEGEKDDILVVAKLAKRCLKLNGKKRPTMKEVTSIINGLTKLQEHSLVDHEKFQNEEDYVTDDQILSHNTSGTLE